MLPEMMDGAPGRCWRVREDPVVREPVRLRVWVCESSREKAAGREGAARVLRECPLGIRCLFPCATGGLPAVEQDAFKGSRTTRGCDCERGNTLIQSQERVRLHHPQVTSPLVPHVSEASSQLPHQLPVHIYIILRTGRTGS